jgi:fructose-1,6-bisphosphatase/inositol monophosphatase family enzyme
MLLGSGDSERVAELMRETAAAELLPRFRTLAKEDIREKRPGDFVTVADEASEQRLAAGLARILPGIPVVGEEAVFADASLLGLIGRPGEACWVVDPLDGTKNFAEGRDRFAMILCLVQDRQSVAGWILNVPTGQMAIAHRGQGVHLDGAAVAPRHPDRPPDGFVGYNVLREFDRQLQPAQRRTLGRVMPGSCSGVEYLELLAGRADFNLYRRSMPWDHAAGTLMVTEAGGDARQPDGAFYNAAQPVANGVLAAISPEVGATVRAAFDAVQMPLLAGLPKS